MKRKCALFVTVFLTTAIMAPSAAFAWTANGVRASERCGAFTGGQVSLNTGETVLSIKGALHNTCPGGQTSVWLSWYEGSPVLCIEWGVGCYNAEDGVAGPNMTVRVSKSHRIILANPGYITVTVCSNYQGWHCGRSVSL
jgi:hypothetical protein